jgi:tRNA nucleotidyltransferase (CCA-adding enzyme)
MKVWKVGGAVRDALMGRPAGDTDWVVTGASPEDMVAAGYTPVGRDFPVFLHPTTHEEYALARTERKTAPGYHGFVFHTDPSVTLEDDLARRDLTINAMAQDDSGAIVDPHGGRRDLVARRLQHVSPAFAEDPVRILRVARFAARFTDFDVAFETRRLMRQMVEAGEVDALVPERIWQEMSRGLMEERPSRMLDMLHGCGALSRLLPEVDATLDPLRRAIDLAAQRDAPLPVRFAALVHRLRDVEALRAVCERWRLPTDCREVAECVLREHATVRQSETLTADQLVGLFDRCDVWRRPERFALVMQACDLIKPADEAPAEARARAARSHLRQALRRAQSVDAGAVATRAATQGARGADIAAAVHAARVTAVDEDLNDEVND